MLNCKVIKICVGISLGLSVTLIIAVALLCVYCIPLSPAKALRCDLNKDVSEINVHCYNTREDIRIEGENVESIVEELNGAIYFRKSSMFDLLKNGNYSCCVNICFKNGDEIAFDVFVDGNHINIGGKKYLLNSNLNDLLEQVFKAE